MDRVKMNLFFYDNVIDHLRDENLPIILCGDWNLVLNFKNDTFRYAKEQNTRAKAKVENMIN